MTHETLKYCAFFKDQLQLPSTEFQGRLTREEFLRDRVVERKLPVEHREQDHPERPHVRRLAQVRLPAQDVRRNVSW
jgi:hypothetical protein